MVAMSTHPPPVRRREIFGWAMFDFANSSYTTIIVTVAYSVYFTKVVVGGDRADWVWSLGITISNTLVVLLAPVVGAVADDSGRKKLFLFATYLVCVVGTGALYFVVPGAVVLGILLFVVSNVAFSFGENFAGAFLPEISTPANIGKISGFGWGLGYFGGLGCLLLVFPLLRGGFTVANSHDLRLAWVVTAAFFLVAAIPTFAFLDERAPRGPRRSVLGYARVGFGHLATTVRSLRQFSELARFLAIFFVYSCGLMAVIAFAAIFAERSLGFAPGELIVLFMVLQLSSAAGALLFGWLQDRLGARATIQLTLVLWVAVCVASYFCTSKAVFWGIALAAGLGIGSLQSASRAMVGLFSPPEKSGEFFGFWGLAGKGAYAVGPATFGVLSSVSGSQRFALLSTAAFFLVGLLGMLFVDERTGHAQARAWHERDAPPR
jgi:UMF1 family MFS transporter